MSRLVLILIALGLAWAAIRFARQLAGAVPARANTRAAYFAAADRLLQDRIQRTEPTGFPRLAGTHQGLRFDLQAVPDTLAVRKLPALWVMVTLAEPQDLAGEVHVMARASGLETFSRNGQMPVEVGLPPDFPEGCTLRCDSPAAIPPPDLMAQLAVLFRDARLKEAILSRQGLRLVTLAEEADRTRYLVFRDAELGATPFPEDRLSQMISDLIALHRPEEPQA